MNPRDLENLSARVIAGVETPDDLTRDDRHALILDVARALSDAAGSPFDVYDLIGLVRAQGAAPTVFTVDDVADRFTGSRDQAQAWLIDNRRHLDEALALRGNEWIEDMLQSDGLFYDEFGDDEEDLQAADEEAYMRARGHTPESFAQAVAEIDAPPSEALAPGDIPNLKALRYTVKAVPGGFIFNDPHGNDYDLAPFATPDDAWLAAKHDARTLPDPDA